MTNYISIDSKSLQTQLMINFRARIKNLLEQEVLRVKEEFAIKIAALALECSETSQITLHESINMDTRAMVFKAAIPLKD